MSDKNGRNRGKGLINARGLLATILSSRLDVIVRRMTYKGDEKPTVLTGSIGIVFHKLYRVCEVK